MSLTLAARDGGVLPPWEPGAHVELLLPSGQVRQYSLCGDPADRETYLIAVLRVPGGRGGSDEVHDRLRAGETIVVRGPRNRFPLVTAPRYIFVSGGIGITALLPMVRAVAARGVPWRLYYTGRHASGMAFAKQAQAIDPRRVEIIATAELGRLDLNHALRSVSADTAVYCCGPEALITEAVEVAAREGCTVRVERFGAPKHAVGSRAAAGDSSFEVELARSSAVGTGLS